MKMIIAVVAILVLVGGIYYFQSSSNAPTIAPGDQTPKTTAPTGTDKAKAKEFTVTASNFKYSPTEIRVKKGDTVTIKLKNTEGFHDFVLDEFSVRSKKINANAEDVVQFVADKTGTFEYYCSVGTHRQMGMVGKLVVE